MNVATSRLANRGEKSNVRHTMAALIIEPFPETLHARLQQTAAAHHRSITQETIHLLEKALDAEPAPSAAALQGYWATRKLLPEYEAALKAGAFSGGTDSTQIISEDRDAR